jgi:hypothetical protein
MCEQTEQTEQRERCRIFFAVGGLRGLTLMFFNLIRENQRNPRFINYYPRMESVEKTKNNKYNKYYAIQRGAILKTRKTRNTNLLIIK